MSLRHKKKINNGDVEINLNLNTPKWSGGCINEFDRATEVADRSQLFGEVSSMGGSRWDVCSFVHFLTLKHSSRVQIKDWRSEVGIDLIVMDE